MFMEPEVTAEQEWYEVESSDGGVEWVPAELVGYIDLDNVGDVIDEACPGWKSACRAVWPFVEGRPLAVTLVRGFGARLSARGFCDATPWTVHESEAAALAYLDEQVEDDADVA